MTAGNTHDLVGAADLLRLVPIPQRLIADRSYDAKKLREWLIERGCEPVIPPNPTRKHPASYDLVTDLNFPFLSVLFLSDAEDVSLSLPQHQPERSGMVRR